MKLVNRKLIVISLSMILIVGIIAYSLSLPISQPNLRYVPVTQSNLSYYQSLNLKNNATYNYDTSQPCISLLPSNQKNLTEDFGFCGKLSVIITHQEQTSANEYLLNESMYASCLINCHGVTYYSDPTALMTNNGHDFMFNCKDFGTSSVISCTSTDFANFFLLSSATSLAVTNTACPATTITSGGLYDSSAVTFTAGTASGGSVTSTLSHTYTAAETDSAVASLCVNTENQAGGNIVDVYEFSFGPDSLVSGNTLALIASLTAI
jgi:hypothetical protein